MFTASSFGQCCVKTLYWKLPILLMFMFLQTACICEKCVRARARVYTLTQQLPDQVPWDSPGWAAGPSAWCFCPSADWQWWAGKDGTDYLTPGSDAACSSDWPYNWNVSAHHSDERLKWKYEIKNVFLDYRRVRYATAQCINLLTTMPKFHYTVS